MKYRYKIRNLFRRKRSMAQISIKYAGNNFWHSIDICELWNSLLGFWEFFQTIAKENNQKNLIVNVSEAKPWCFDILLDIDANTLLKWIEVWWWIIGIAVWVIELKKYFKWDSDHSTEVQADGQIKITKEWSAPIIVQRNVYNTYTKCNIKIDKELSEAFSPLIDNDSIEDISIGIIKENTAREPLVNVNKEEASYFRSEDCETKVIEWAILQGRIVTMNIDTYRGTMEHIWRKEYIDFSRVRLDTGYMKAINNSMMNREDIVVKCNIEYELGKIRLITILWIIPSRVFEEK